MFLDLTNYLDNSPLSININNIEAYAPHGQGTKLIPVGGDDGGYYQVNEPYEKVKEAINALLMGAESVSRLQRIFPGYGVPPVSDQGAVAGRD